MRPIIGSQLFIFIIGLFAFSWLYFFRLGTLVKGLSQSEAAAAANSSSLEAIWHNPMYAPHKLLQLGLRQAFGYHPWSLRLASVIFAALFLVCFYIICARWFGRLIGTVSTLALAAMPWVCLLGRSATPAIMLLIPAMVLMSYNWFSRAKKWLSLSWILFCLCAAIALYIPGLVWVLLVGIVINRRSLIFSLKRLKSVKLIVGCLIFCVLLTPLVWSFVMTPSLMYHWLLIPTAWIGFSVFIKNLGWAIASLFVRTPMHFEWSVGRLPVFTILTSALAVFGAYAMSLQARQKLYAMISLLLFGCLATAINSNYSYLSLCLVPLLLLSAAGLRYLFLQWQAVFPRNPLPRYFAYGLIVLLAVGQLAYGVRACIFAWPHTSETKTVFVLK